MRARFFVVVIFLAAGLGAARADPPRVAGPVAVPTGPINEQVWWVPMEVPRKKDVILHLETTVYRPNGAGPFPLILLNHGSPGDAAARRKNPRTRFFDQSRWFVERGYAVAIPMRRGYANSEGEWAEGYKGCDDPDYTNAGFTTANDIGAVLKYLQGQPFVDAKRVVIVGQSAGGFGALAAASRNPPGVLGVINFAGGRGAVGEIGTVTRVCKEERLVEASARFGKTARVPALWLYAANDLHFRPELAARMLDAYRSNGGRAEFVAMPAYGKNGHDTFASWRASTYWTGTVDRFLKTVTER